MQKKLADEIQTEAYKEVPYVPTGQFVVPTAYRKTSTASSSPRWSSCGTSRSSEVSEIAAGLQRC